MADPETPRRPIAPLPPDAEEVALPEAETSAAATPTTPAPTPAAAAAAADGDRPTEYGGRKGPEPTRYGDWEKNGIISDF